MTTTIKNYNLSKLTGLTDSNNTLSNVSINNSIIIPKSAENTNTNSDNANAGFYIKDVNSNGSGDFYRVKVDSEPSSIPALYFNNNEVLDRSNVLSTLESILEDYTLDTSNLMVTDGYINFANGSTPNTNQGNAGVGLRYSSANTVQFKNYDTDWIDLVDIINHDEFKELVDVDVTTNPLLNNHYITYNSVTAKFVNSNLSISHDTNPTLAGDLNVGNYLVQFGDNDNENRLVYNAKGIIDNNLIVLKNNSTLTNNYSYLEINNADINGIVNPSIIVKSTFTDSNVGVELTTLNAGDINLNATTGNVNVNATHLVVSGDLVVQGTTTTIESIITVYKDPVIQLGGSNVLVSNDGKDRGISFKYYDGGDKTGFMGYDNDTGNFIFKKNATIINDVVVSGTNAGITFGAFTSTGDLDVTGTITGDTSLTLDTTTITTAEIGVLDGVTPGTATASKALVLDDSKDIGTIRNLTIDGIFTDGNYTFDTSGNVSGLGTVGCGAITTSGAITNAVVANANNIFATSTGKTTLGGGAIDMGATATATTIKGTLNVVEAVTLDTTLDVTGITTLTGDLNIEGDIDMATGKKLTWVYDNQSISGTATGITIETDDILQLNADTSVTMDAPSVVFTSTTSEKPLFEIVNAANDATGSHLRLANKRGSNNGANADVAGTVDFFTNNDAQNNQGFAEVKVVATATTSGSEQGTMTIGVACTDNGGIDTVLTIAGGTNAAGSTTTIAGNLNVIGAAGATNIVFGTSAGSALADGAINNVIIGQDALNVVTTGDNNTAIGFEALKAQHATIGNNVAVGSGAGVAITTGTKNVIIGKDAAAGASTANNCVVIGEGTCAATMTGIDNVVIGQAAGAALVGGHSNTILGKGAGDATTDVDSTVIIGKGACAANMTAAADGTVAIGAGAGAALTSGTGTTVLGFNAGAALTTALNNTAIGYEALSTEDANGDQNTAIGYQALKAMKMNADTDTHGQNTALGYQAGVALTTGIKNTIIGASAGTAAISGYGNVIVGYEAGKVITEGFNNVTIGSGAGTEITSGISNVLLGTYAGWHIQTGACNIAIGTAALGSQNLAVSNNVAIGFSAGFGLTTGTENVMIGSSAAVAATTSDNCVVIGGSTCAANMTGNDNVVVGQAAGAELLAGADNVFIGQAAGNTATTGSTNVCVGNDADVSGTGATNQIAIGAGVTCQADNQVVLGNSSVTDVFMAQDKGATVHCAGINVGVPIVMADSAAVDLVHATHSGRILVLPIVGQNSTLNLPTPTTPFGQHYHFIYGGTSVETHYFIIRTKTIDDSVLIQGSINWTDSHSSGGVAAIANGTEALTIHNAGSIDVHFVAASASLWYVWGAINADITPAWST